MTLALQVFGIAVGAIVWAAIWFLLEPWLVAVIDRIGVGLGSIPERYARYCEWVERRMK